MKAGKQRLAKVAGALTPQQAVLAWMEGAHQFPSLVEYVQSLKGLLTSVFPLMKLPRQVEHSVRLAMKGQPWDVVDLYVRQAVRDTMFLAYLHHRANLRFLEKQEEFRLSALSLWQELRELQRQDLLSRDMMMACRHFSEATPYPLDPETAAAIDAAQEAVVQTWESLEEVGTLTGWVTGHFQRQGKTRLPFGVYRLQEPEAENDSVEAEADEWWPFPKPDRNEIAALFPDAGAFADFLAGRDFHYGLSDVRDAEVEQAYAQLESALRRLIAVGEVREGKLVRLESVPLGFLQEAPLIEGEWLDRFVLELAEWGALLTERGYRVLPTYDDDHPFAWGSILPQELGRTALSDEEEGDVSRLRDQARAHLGRFRGERRSIGGLEYLRFADYCGWRGRWVKGDLREQVQPGLDLDSWNAWVAEHGGEGVATLAGVPVRPISSWASTAPVRVCLDGDQAAAERWSRERVLADLTAWTVHDYGDAEGEDIAAGAGLWRRVLPLDKAPFLQKLADWRLRALTCHNDVASLAGAVEQIGRRYFGGRGVLFPEAAEHLGALQDAVQACVEHFNKVFAARMRWRSQRLSAPPESAAGGRQPADQGVDLTIRLRELEAADRVRAGVLVTYLVDMAKAEALEYIGEDETAFELVGRHIVEL